LPELGSVIARLLLGHPTWRRTAKIIVGERPAALAARVGQVQRTDELSVLAWLVGVQMGDEALVTKPASEAVDHQRASVGAGNADDLTVTAVAVCVAGQ
jgi:hypothetical protein